MPELNRRDFLATAAAVTCAGAMNCPFALAADDKPAAADAGPIDVGTLSDFPKDGPYDKFAKKPTSLLVVRDGGKLYAPTAMCTHKNANLKVEDGEIICPKHDSPFDNQGLPKPMTKEGDETPAKRPLVRYAITQRANGRIVVDKSRTFEQDKWGDAGSFVKVG